MAVGTFRKFAGGRKSKTHLPHQLPKLLKGGVAVTDIGVFFKLMGCQRVKDRTMKNEQTGTEKLLALYKKATELEEAMGDIHPDDLARLRVVERLLEIQDEITRVLGLSEAEIRAEIAVRYPW
jgi:hypothetical protein